MSPSSRGIPRLSTLGGQERNILQIFSFCYILSHFFYIFFLNFHLGRSWLCHWLQEECNYFSRFRMHMSFQVNGKKSKGVQNSKCLYALWRNAMTSKSILKVGWSSSEFYFLQDFKLAVTETQIKGILTDFI